MAGAGRPAHGRGQRVRLQRHQCATSCSSQRRPPAAVLAKPPPGQHLLALSARTEPALRELAGRYAAISAAHPRAVVGRRVPFGQRRPRPFHPSAGARGGHDGADAVATRSRCCGGRGPRLHAWPRGAARRWRSCSPGRGRSPWGWRGGCTSRSRCSGRRSIGVRACWRGARCVVVERGVRRAGWPARRDGRSDGVHAAGVVRRGVVVGASCGLPGVWCRTRCWAIRWGSTWRQWWQGCSRSRTGCGWSPRAAG